MKTLIIYDDMYNDLQFLIVDGDYSKFNGVLVNGVIGTGFEQEFCNFMFDSITGDCKHTLSTDKALLENKQWDKVAICTHFKY